MRYVANLFTVKAMRAFMVENGDLDGLRSLAYHATSFAYFSIHNTVQTQERYFAEMVAGIWTPRGLPAHRMPAVSRDLANALPIDVFTGEDSTALCETLVTWKWLAAPKAHFSAALMGFMDAPCIDSHMAKMLGTKSIPPKVANYRAFVAAGPINSTLAQWDAYNMVDAFAAGQHDVYFSAVLGSNAQVAN